MIRQIVIRERGPAPRGFARLFGKLQAAAWEVAAIHFHSRFRDDRFTESHAQKMGYTRRKGEGMAHGSKAFRNSYTGRKLAKFGHTRPLEWSGETRRAVAMANITTTRNAAKISYAGARKFNFRHPKSQIRMADEFRSLANTEIQELGRIFDRDLDARVAQDMTTTVTVVG